MGKNKFIKIYCPRCKEPHITFTKASTWIKCEACNKLLVKPKGGKAKVKARVKKII